MNEDLLDLSLGTLIVLKPIHYLLTIPLGAAPENIPKSFASWRSNCCLPYRHFRTEQNSKYTRCGFIHSEDDKPNTTDLQQSHHIFMFNQIFFSCQAPSAVSIFRLSLFRQLVLRWWVTPHCISSHQTASCGPSTAMEVASLYQAHGSRVAAAADGCAKG